MNFDIDHAKQMEAIRDAASRYNKMGFNVIPNIFGQKTPPLKWTKYQTQRFPEEELLKYLNSGKLYNIGALMGTTSGMIAIDFDYGMKPMKDMDGKEIVDENGHPVMVMKNGKASFDALCRSMGYPILSEESTFTTRTGSGGMHMVFRTERSAEIGSPAPWKGLGLTDVDVRSHGSQIILPPSWNKFGQYSVTFNAEPQKCPQWLEDLLIQTTHGDGGKRQSKRNAGTAKSKSQAPKEEKSGLLEIGKYQYFQTIFEGEIRKVRGAQEGERNSTLFAAACNLFGCVKSGLFGHDETEAALRSAAEQTGLDDREISTTLNSAYNKTEPRELNEYFLAKLAKAEGRPIPSGMVQTEEPEPWERMIPLTSVKKAPRLSEKELDELVPEPLCSLIKFISKDMGFQSYEIPLLAGIEAVAGAAQSNFRVEQRLPKGPVYDTTLCLWSILAMDSSARKSGAIEPFIEPLQEWQIEKRREASKENKKRERKNKILDKQIAAIQNSIKAETTDEERVDKDKEIARLEAQKQQLPVRPSFCRVADATAEGSYKAWKENPFMGILMHDQEGGFFDKSDGLYSGNLNIDFFNKAYDGQHHDITRAGASESDPDPILPPLLSICIYTQKETLQNHKNAMVGRGFWNRFLFCVPDKQPYKEMEPKKVKAELKQDLAQSLNILLPNEMMFFPDDEGNYKWPYRSEKITITTSDEAGLIFKNFTDELLSDNTNGLYPGIVGWIGKHHTRVLKIAALWTLLKKGEKIYEKEESFYGAFVKYPNAVIDAETMRQAIKLGRFFIPHAVRAFEYITGRSITEKNYALDWILKNGLVNGEPKIFSINDMWKGVYSHFKDTKELTEMLKDLTERGILREIQVKKEAGSIGAPKKPRYQANPNLWAEEEAEEEEAYSVEKADETDEDEELEAKLRLEEEEQAQASNSDLDDSPF